MKNRSNVLKDYRSHAVLWLSILAAGALLIWIVKILKETGHDEAVAVLLLAAAAASIYLACRYGGQPKNQQSNREKLEALRLKWLASPLEEIATTASADSTGIAVVVMDVNTGEYTYSVWASMHGDAGLFTTGAFGVIGGKVYESVGDAVRALCTEAEKCLPCFERTTSFPYPDENKVAFYIRCQDEVFATVVEMAEIESETHRLFPLFMAGHGVLAQLRSTAQRVTE